MATASWQAQVKVSGAAVAMTGEACTSLGGGQYQVTNAAKRILVPSASVVVKDAGSPVSVALWSVDRLFGVVTFSGYTPSGAVTIDASYVPVGSVGESKAINIKASAELVDVSAFESSARKRQTALVEVEGSIERLALPLDDLDGVTAGTQSLDGWMRAGTPRLLDVLFATGARFRAWVLFGGYDVQGEVAGVVTVSVKFSGAAQGAGASFGWGT